MKVPTSCSKLVGAIDLRTIQNLLISDKSLDEVIVSCQKSPHTDTSFGYLTSSIRAMSVLCVLGVFV